MEIFVTIVHIITATLIIAAVLLQGGNQGGMGAAFGGGNSSSTFGATGSTSFFGKLTYITAAIFMVTSILLTILQGAGYDIGLTDKIVQDAEDNDAESHIPLPNPDAPMAESPPQSATGVWVEGSSEGGSEPSAQGIEPSAQGAKLPLDQATLTSPKSSGGEEQESEDDDDDQPPDSSSYEPSDQGTPQSEHQGDADTAHQ